MDRRCADVRDPSPPGRLRAAGFAVVVRPGVARSGRCRRGVRDVDSPVASVRLRRGVGSARRGLRREVAVVARVAAGRLRGRRPVPFVVDAVGLFAVLDARAVGLVLAVAFRLSPPAVLPLPTVPSRCDVTGVWPFVPTRAPIHCSYPQGDPRKPNSAPEHCTHEVPQRGVTGADRPPGCWRSLTVPGAYRSGTTRLTWAPIPGVMG